MKNNLLVIAMAGLLGISTVSAAVLTFQYNRSLSQARRLQAQLDTVNRSRNIIQSLANDAVEYGKRNPAIDPILQQFNLKAATAPQKPAPVPAKR